MVRERDWFREFENDTHHGHLSLTLLDGGQPVDLTGFEIHLYFKRKNHDPEVIVDAIGEKRDASGQVYFSVPINHRSTEYKTADYRLVAIDADGRTETVVRWDVIRDGELDAATDDEPITATSDFFGTHVKAVLAKGPIDDTIIPGNGDTTETDYLTLYRSAKL